MVPFITDFFNGLKDFSDSYWFYVIILAIAILDSVFPIVPSETLVIIGGVSAGSGSLSLGLVMACAFSGAFIGDHLSYFLGRRASDLITRRYERTEKGKHRLASVIHQIHERRQRVSGQHMRLCSVLLVERPLKTITRWRSSSPLVALSE